MKRRLLNLLTALSLVLCVAVAAALARSVAAPDAWNRLTADPQAMTMGQDAVASTSGYLQYQWQRQRAVERSVRGYLSARHMLAWQHQPAERVWRHRHWLVPVYRRVESPNGAAGTVIVPYLPLLLVTALPPALALRRTLRRRRARRRNLCPACGYEMTGNVSGVCPECGSEATVKTPPGTAGVR